MTFKTGGGDSPKYFYLLRFSNETKNRITKKKKNGINLIVSFLNVIRCDTFEAVAHVTNQGWRSVTILKKNLRKIRKKIPITTHYLSKKKKKLGWEEGKGEFGRKEKYTHDS